MSTVKFEMQNGEVDLTLNFYTLNQLKTKHPKEYKRFFELRKNGVTTELDGAEMIYTAYLCANMDKMPDVMSYEEFLQNMKNSRSKLWKAVSELNADEKN